MVSLRYVASGVFASLIGGWLVLAACGPEASSGFIDATDIPDGGLLVNPLVLACGRGVACAIEETAGCCDGIDGGPACADDSSTCPPNSGLMTCNEGADCPPGKLCCAAIVAKDAGGGYLTSACAAACPAPGIQLCRTNGECSGDHCVLQTCPDRQAYEMCGLSTAAAFPCTR